MNTGEKEKIETNISGNSPKCDKRAFYRMSSEDHLHCYFLDPSPKVSTRQVRSERMGPLKAYHVKQRSGLDT